MTDKQLSEAQKPGTEAQQQGTDTQVRSQQQQLRPQQPRHLGLRPLQQFSSNQPWRPQLVFRPPLPRPRPQLQRPWPPSYIPRQGLKLPLVQPRPELEVTPRPRTQGEGPRQQAIAIENTQISSDLGGKKTLNSEKDGSIIKAPNQSSKSPTRIKELDNEHQTIYASRPALRRSSKVEEFLQEDYSPNENRPKNGLNWWQAYALTLKGALGTCVLIVPAYIAKVGIVPAIFWNIACTIIIMHCMLLVFRSSYFQCKRHRLPVIPHHDALTATIEYGPEKLQRFGKCCGHLLACVQISEHFIFCCLYIEFNMLSAKKLFNMELNVKNDWKVHYCSKGEPKDMFLNFYLDPVTDSRVLQQLLFFGPMIIINIIPNLKLFAPFAALGTVLILFALVLFIYLTFILPKPDETEILLIGDITQAPLYLCSLLFSNISTGLAALVENNMSEPKLYHGAFGVYSKALMINFLICMTFVIMVYNFCRNACAQAVFGHLPDNWIGAAFRWIYIVGAMITSTLNNCVVVATILDYSKKWWPDMSERTFKLSNYLVRALLYVFSWLLVLAIPNFAKHASPLIAVFIPLTVIVLPVLMDAIETQSMFSLVKDIFLFILGIVILMFAFADAIHELFYSKNLNLW